NQVYIRQSQKVGIDFRTLLHDLSVIVFRPSHHILFHPSPGVVIPTRLFVVGGYPQLLGGASGGHLGNITVVVSRKHKGGFSSGIKLEVVIQIKYPFGCSYISAPSIAKSSNFRTVGQERLYRILCPPCAGLTSVIGPLKRCQGFHIIVVGGLE